MGAGRCDHNEYAVPLGGSAWEDSGAGALVLVGGGAWGESGVVFPVAAVGRVTMRGRGRCGMELRSGTRRGESRRESGEGDQVGFVFHHAVARNQGREKIGDGEV